MTKRTDRLNSLLKEVLSEVILQEVRNPHVSSLTSVTHVDIAPDLHTAKVFISVIGTTKDKDLVLAALQSAAGFISVHASKKVSMRYFPSITFYLDSSVDDQLRIHSLLEKIHDEEQSRHPQ